MKSIRTALMVTATLMGYGLAAWAAAPSQQETTMIEYSLKPITGLVCGELTHLAPFTPALKSQAPDTNPRHVPLVESTVPWDKDGTFIMEIPEYSWASIDGDPHSGSPFFYGRPLSQAVQQKWHIRFPSKERPVWINEGGALKLDNELEGGYVQRFRVIPRDRMIEIRFGITNNADKPLKNLRCQVCSWPSSVKEFAERWPTSSKLYSAGEVVTWDSLGQSLAWLDAFYDKERRTFSQSCFFNVPMPGYLPPNYPEKERAREDLMWFNRPVDVPAIAKQSIEHPERNIIVYSPFGRDAFYNSLVPCFHADPHMNQIAPGETRWTISYIVFFEGDLGALFRELSKKHQELARTEGILE